MERAILVIVLIVALVGVVGFYSSYDFTAPTDAIAPASPTGHVVASDTVVEPYVQQECASCTGYAPVCARLNHKYVTYDNACLAECNGATVARSYPCEQLR